MHDAVAILYHWTRLLLSRFMFNVRVHRAFGSLDSIVNGQICIKIIFIIRSSARSQLTHITLHTQATLIVQYISNF